jgi:hypothetical protein
VLEQGFRTPDLVHGKKAAGLTVLSTKEMGAKVREAVKEQLLAASR